MIKESTVGHLGQTNVDTKLYNEMKKFIDDIALSMNLSAVEYAKSKELSQKLK